MILCLNKADKITTEEANKKVSIINNFVKDTDNKAICVAFSAKHKTGISSLRDAMKSFESHLVSNSDSTFITNIRHYDALRQAASSLQDARTALSNRIPSDLVAEDLRRAITSLNQILGQDIIDPESVLRSIFGKHCIGK